MEANTQAAPLPTVMDAGLYRKNVMRTLSIKPAKLGLMVTARNTERTNVQHCIDGFVSETLEFFKAMRPYVEGQQLSKVNLKGSDGVVIELGDVGYYLAVLCKVLKLKAFSAKKKVKLETTITAAMMDLLACASDLADLAKKTYYGPKTTSIVKQVKNPKTQEVSDKTVIVVDKEAEAAAWTERKALMVPLIERAAELHSMLCLAILGTTTAPVNMANILKLAVRYPEGYFELIAAEKKNPEAEAEAAEAASKEPVAA